MRQRGFIAIPALPLMTWLAIGGAVVLLLSWGALYIQTQRLETVKDEYAEFAAMVKVAGEQAQKAADAQAAQDKRNKERADAEHMRATTALRADIARMRESRSGGNFLSPAAPGAKRPDLACYDRTELESAIRGLDKGLQGLVDEGSQATVDLNTLKLWAQ